MLWLLRDRLDIEFIPIGSAGAKAMAVLRGDTDAYIHAGGQWGGIRPPGRCAAGCGFPRHPPGRSPLRYNRPDPYLPDFLDVPDPMSGLLLDAMWRVG